MAAVLNVVLAIVSGLFPDPFFALFATVPPDDPCPWSWVAVAIGACGLLYLYAAWRPEQADVAIAVGLVSKMMGPIAWLGMLGLGRATPALFPLVVGGDIIWWLPFAWFLLRRTPWRKTVIAWFSVAAHLAASVGLLLVAQGTELNTDLAARQQWIVASIGIWVATWTCWSVSSLSLLAVCLAWSDTLRQPGKWRLAEFAAAIVAVGVCFDLAGESVAVTQLTRSGLSLPDFAFYARWYQWLSPLVANGLYPVGGIVLSCLAWQSGQLRGAAGVAGFAMWSCAIILTIATLVSQTAIMTASGALIMLLYLYWATSLGIRWRPTSDSAGREPRSGDRGSG